METHVDTQVWKEMTQQIDIEKLPGWRRRRQLALIVLEQLKNGANSGVKGPGLTPIHVNNCLQDKEVDPSRLLDALLKAVQD